MSRGAATPAQCAAVATCEGAARVCPWSLPGGRLRSILGMTSSIGANWPKVACELAHLEQLAVFSDPHRLPGIRMIASTWGWSHSPATPELCQRTAGTVVLAANGVRSRSDGDQPAPG